MRTVQIGVDVGGTFTDVVLLDQLGRTAVKKVLSTPPDYSEGIERGVSELLTENGLSGSSVIRFVHATTVATNTVLEQKGARTGLLTTKGFRDVLEMRRLRIPVLYNIQYDKPPPLVPRRLRVEVAERMLPDGTVNVPLDCDAVQQAAKFFQREHVEAVAVAFLHSYKNPAHEIEAESILRESLGSSVYLCRSSGILPEIREYERTSTAVVNAYVAPTVARYLGSLERRLRAIKVHCPIEIMHSAGAVMRFQTAMRKPAYLVESGPAAGVVASGHIARAAAQQSVISFDMGGTTAKAAMIEGGQPAKTTEYEVGAGINLSSKLVKGGGYPIKLPFIDISEIGAGGGSIIQVDDRGRVSVGPSSAGSIPGPVCYSQGGVDATLTDALVVLGYINPSNIAGGSVKLNSSAALAAMTSQVATPLGLSTYEAAHGVLKLGIATMTRAVKAVSTYRGRDPRDFMLHAFGGNGAVVACAIARELEMTQVVVPPAAGVFSAYGLLYADVEQEALRTVMLSLAVADTTVVAETFLSMQSEVVAALQADGYGLDRIQVVRQADLRYTGQAYELTVPLEGRAVDLHALAAQFHREHARTYGHSSTNDPVEIVNLRVTGRLASGVAPAQPDLPESAGDVSREVYFGAAAGALDTPVIARQALLAGSRTGPLIIEDYDSTCVVPPEWSACLDALGNIVIKYRARNSHEN